MKSLFFRLFKTDLLRFIFVGGCSTIIDFIIYMLLSLQCTITISKGISMIFASFFSYYFNKNYTFDVKEKTTVAYITKFYVVFVANWSSNLLTNYVVYNRCFSKTIAFICATLVGITVNYLGQKYVVFKK